MTLNGVMTHRNFTGIFGVRKLQSVGHHEALFVVCVMISLVTLIEHRFVADKSYLHRDSIIAHTALA